MQYSWLLTTLPLQIASAISRPSAQNLSQAAIVFTKKGRSKTLCRKQHNASDTKRKERFHNNKFCRLHTRSEGIWLYKSLRNGMDQDKANTEVNCNVTYYYSCHPKALTNHTLHRMFPQKQVLDCPVNCRQPRNKNDVRNFLEKSTLYSFYQQLLSSSKIKYRIY